MFVNRVGVNRDCPEVGKGSFEIENRKSRIDNDRKSRIENRESRIAENRKSRIENRKSQFRAAKKATTVDRYTEDRLWTVDCGPWTHEVTSITSHHKKLKSESADAGDCRYLALVVKVT
jgi:hypothetical protein